MKFIRVNMSNKTIKVDDVPEKYEGLGGRSLTSTIVNEEVPPKCDPLGPENKLIFAPGTLSGTTMINTSRISVGSKSPLTGGIKESNAGGTIGAAVAKLGIAAIVIEGKAPEGEFHLLQIDIDGNVALSPAEEYKGMRTYKTVEGLLEKYGKKNSVMCIGPAGEFLLKSSSIQASDVDGRPCRAAGRGGLGAVMGSKGLKALVVAQGGKEKAPVADPERFKKAVKEIIDAIKEDPFSGQVMPNLGTAALVAPVNSMGGFPTYNGRQGVLEGWEKISGEAIAEIIKKRGGNTTHMGCSQCIIHCSNEYVDEKGKYVTSSLEYETIWAIGGMSGVVDIDTIAQFDFMCDDIGLDTMNTGVAIAVAMDSGYREFGDKKAVIEMTEEIAQGTEFGRILGNGPASVGKHFNNPRVPVVKNQSIAAYDPRALQGNGVTYATTPMGADHTAANLVGAYIGQQLDPLSPEGQVEASRNLQYTMAVADATGMCMMAALSLLSPEASEAFRSAISAKTGKEIKPEDFPSAMGIQIIKTEKEFNRKAGLTNKDDRLPDMFTKEPLPPHNTVFKISDEELDLTFNF
ncbi:MAG: aldehyde ferredoxin oxidoreductase [Spirochaetes bacterium]|nr:aldehyde ferredoxin oxidoreductase [Spirochaetota bacterium]